MSRVTILCMFKANGRANKKGIYINPTKQKKNLMKFKVKTTQTVGRE